MTWKEFKETVEKRGVKDDDKIEWIDAVYPTSNNITLGFTTDESGRSVKVECWP